MARAGRRLGDPRIDENSPRLPDRAARRSQDSVFRRVVDGSRRISLHRYPVNNRKRTLRDIAAELEMAGHTTSAGERYAAAAIGPHEDGDKAT